MVENWKVRNYSVGYLANYASEIQLVASVVASPNLACYSLLIIKTCTWAKRDLCNAYSYLNNVFIQTLPYFGS